MRWPRSPETVPVGQRPGGQSHQHREEPGVARPPSATVRLGPTGVAVPPGVLEMGDGGWTQTHQV